MSEADIARVIDVFDAHQVSWALVGAHAIGLLTEPRATADFDFIIEGAKLRLVVGALTEAFGELDETDVGAAIRLKAIDVDLIRSTNHPLFQIALDQSHPHHRRLARAAYRGAHCAHCAHCAQVPGCGEPVARPQQAQADVTDIGLVYGADGASLDRAWMLELSKAVHPGAEREFRDRLDKINRGDPISI